MARPVKQTVDYFPHMADSGDTISTLENLWGIHGYAFWFKLLETLCKSDGHYFDFSNDYRRQVFLGKTRVKEETAIEILNALAKMDNIDPELWNNNRVIWCQALINNISDAYKNRVCALPSRPEFLTRKQVRNPAIQEFPTEETPQAVGITSPEKPQSKLKKIRGGGEEAIHIDNVIDSDKDKSDAAAPPPPASRPAPSSAAPSSSPSPEGSGVERKNKPHTIRKGNFPEADIIAVAAAYCDAKHVTFVNDMARSAHLRSKAVFYDAKDFLALNGGDVERTRQAIKDFAEGYEDEGKPGWNWSYLQQDWSKPIPGYGKTWDEIRREYELEQSKEKAQ